MDKTMFTKLFAPFDRDATPRYRALREEARARFATLPLPTVRSEDWRFTNIAPLAETSFELPNALMESGPAAPKNKLQFHFLNGRFAPAISSPVPSSISIGSLANAPSSLPLVGKIADVRANAFTALNASFVADGLYVTIPDDVILETPIEIIHYARSDEKPVVIQPRTLIVIGKNARATVVERYFGGQTYFTNAVTEITLSDYGVLDHVKVQEESVSAYHIANTQVVMAAKSNFTTHYLSLGGALVRNEVRVRFDGEHAEATVNGLYLADGKQHMDNFTVIDHAQPNCASHELYKGILDGKSHGVFNGKIFVRKDAQKTDAKQTNKVLLLSDDATINTKPQLEIFADDVKCTHGATIGQLDATQLFYLQSRGIPLEPARRLLTFAFANDIVNRVKIEAIRAEMETRIVR
ncbi:MAG: Fe-S cluster assembly protein SufD [Planctomycetes bacterium]|nr:Fe-S cluster assembly protein SufD [Planctomycetota bacterium]